MAHFRLSAILDAIDALATPPCKGAPVFLWLCFIAMVVFATDCMLWRGNLSDPDDYLYLVQAIDWLHGQSWFDRLQHRMDPPQGTVVHFSHLLSGFYGCCIFLLDRFCGLITAAWLTAVAIPPLYFGVFLFVMMRLGRRMIGPEWGDMTAYFVFFSPGLGSQFMLGHLDHHGLEALLALIAFYGMARMVERPAATGWAAATGLTLAFGLYIGLELLPVAEIFGLCLGLWVMSEGGAAIRSGSIFGLSLFLAGAAFLFIARAPQQLLDIDIDSYSVVYVVLCGCIALCFGVLELTGKNARVLTRYAAGCATAAGAGLMFLHALPQMLWGPYGGMTPTLAKLIFDTAPEAWPLFDINMPPVKSFLLLVLPVMAAAANLFMLARPGTRAQRWIWGMHLAVLLACFVLGVFYQQRFYSYVATFSIVPLTAMIAYDWARVPDAAPLSRRLRIARLVILLLAGPALSLVLSGYQDNLARAPNQPPQAQSSGHGCDMHGLADRLNDKNGLGAHTHLIMNSINEGPELMFRTPHAVVAGPFHTNVGGNLDALRFFGTRDPAEAESIARQRGADLVVICTLPGQLRAYFSTDTVTPGAPFVQQLIDGPLPAWLTRIEAPGLNDFMLFEIRS